MPVDDLSQWENGYTYDKTSSRGRQEAPLIPRDALLLPVNRGVNSNKLKLWKQPLIAFVLLSIVFVVSAVGRLYYFGRGICRYSVYRECVSPSGELEAVVFKRVCGATTAVSARIAFMTAISDLKNESGNVYIVEGQPNPP